MRTGTRHQRVTRTAVLVLSLGVAPRLCGQDVVLQIEWEREYGIYGYSMDNAFNSIEPTADGGFILAGFSGSYDGEEGIFEVVKLDARGERVWSEAFGHGEAKVARETADESYLAAGVGELAVLEIDGKGDLVWAVERAPPLPGGASDVRPVSDGGYIALGSVRKSPADADAVLVRLGPRGEVVWSREHGGDGNDGGRFVLPARDGGYVFAGSTIRAENQHREKIWVVKTDASGELVWERFLDGHGLDPTVSAHGTGGLLERRDGAVVVAGRAAGMAVAATLDGEGNTLWETRFGADGTTYCQALEQAADGSYVLAGYVAAPLRSFLAKLSSEGKHLWAGELIPGMAGLAVAGTAEGGYVLAGMRLVADRAVSTLGKVVRLQPEEFAPDVAFVRGDTNDDGRIDISDGVRTLVSLFLDPAEPRCASSHDIDDDGSLDVSDAVNLLQYLFRGGTAPEAPFPDCGTDPTADETRCDAHLSCQR